MSYTLVWIEKNVTEEGLSWDELVEKLGSSDAAEDALDGSDGVVEAFHEDDEWDDGDYQDPVEADAEVLAMAGMGTDEDYGYFGGDEW